MSALTESAVEPGPGWAGARWSLGDATKEGKGAYGRKRSGRQGRKRERGPEEAGMSPAALAGAITAAGLAGVWSVARGVQKVLHGYRVNRLRKMLLEVSPVLDQACGDAWWVDFGSLLGIYRDGDLIPYDNDVDICVLNPDWEALYETLQTALEPEYRVRWTTPSEDPTVRWIRVLSPMCMIDIYGAHCDVGATAAGRGATVHVELGHGDQNDMAADMVLPTRRMDFRGVQIGVPSQVEELLRYRYGDTWMIPIYMDKGRDEVEGNKAYARVLRFVGRFGLKF
ncbi:unnamed protein product [Pedinophyceae sp. YPF-701]|nr:unnamed protein product [Pedinophyceae sp. YPF-701]